MTEIERLQFIKNIEALRDKFDKINAFIEAGEEIPKELSKNFVTFPLVDDPYSDID